MVAELGVDFDHIREKVMLVLNPRIHVDEKVLNDTDLAGPLVFACILGCCSLLVGPGSCTRGWAGILCGARGMGV